MYLSSLLIPVSQDKIHYVHDFDIKSLDFDKTKRTVLKINELTLDIMDFLKILNEDDNY
jgi:hypothetical protein